MTEIWLKEKNWIKIKGKLPEKYSWKCIPARKDKKKGRAKEGIITTVKIEMEEIENREINAKILERKIKIGGKTWRL